MDSPRLNRLSHLSSIATALVAVIAVAIAVWQIKAAESMQREASAREAFKEYLKIAIDKPELADARLDGKSTDKTRSAYGWFVTYFLYSAEQIAESYPDDPAWQRGLADEICYHHAYLSTPEVRETVKQQHDPQFAEFVEASLRDCPDD